MSENTAAALMFMAMMLMLAWVFGPHPWNRRKK
jgi:hypothetical protein